MRSPGGALRLGAVGATDEAGPEPRFVRRPAAGNPAAEEGGPQPRALETRLAVEVSARHARDLAGRVQAGDRLEVAVQHAAADVGLDAAEVLAGEREELDRVVGRSVESLGLAERLAERRVLRQP